MGDCEGGGDVWEGEEWVEEWVEEWAEEWVEVALIGDIGISCVVCAAGGGCVVFCAPKMEFIICGIICCIAGDCIIEFIAGMSCSGGIS